MKNTKLLVVLLLVTALFTSCKKEKEEETKDLTADIVSVYEGTMQTDQGFMETDYDVTVTKVSNDKIKITPEDNNATEFEVSIKEGANSSIVSTTADATFSVTFQEVGGTLMLSYVYTNSNGVKEQFSGEKQ